MSAIATVLDGSEAELAIASEVPTTGLPDGVHPEPLAAGAGWCVKTRADQRFCIDVLPMLYNYRIVLSPRCPQPHLTYSHGWCYFGHGYTSSGAPRTMRTAAVAAILAAAAWDGYGEPAGYDKQAV